MKHFKEWIGWNNDHDCKSRSGIDTFRRFVRVDLAGDGREQQVWKAQKKIDRQLLRKAAGICRGAWRDTAWATQKNTKGDKLTGGYVWIDDYQLWRLPPLALGQDYVKYDNEVYRVVRETAVVLEAFGIVSHLLK